MPVAIVSWVFFLFIKGSEGTVQSSTSHVLKEVVPKVVVTVAAHTGRHYWTNVESRRAAVCESF